jgi:(E)-4-hydroxy-3-methylbut-2-enyl-diphosphate synthase
MVDLYVGKQCVEKNIPFAEADERLVLLVKAHGRWVDPEQPTIAIAH